MFNFGLFWGYEAKTSTNLKSQMGNLVCYPLVNVADVEVDFVSTISVQPCLMTKLIVMYVYLTAREIDEQRRKQHGCRTFTSRKYEIHNVKRHLAGNWRNRKYVNITSQGFKEEKTKNMRISPRRDLTEQDNKWSHHQLLLLPLFGPLPPHLPLSPHLPAPQTRSQDSFFRRFPCHQLVTLYLSPLL